MLPPKRLPGRVRGVEPQVPLPEIMQEYVDWMRSLREDSRSYLSADRIMLEKGVVRQAGAV